MTRPSDIRRCILKQRGIEFKKLSRKSVSIEETLSLYKKTNLMKLLELRHKEKLESLISRGTIYEVGKRLGVSGAVISKWRKRIAEAKDKAFFEQFK